MLKIAQRDDWFSVRVHFEKLFPPRNPRRKQWSRLKWRHYPPLPTELPQKPKKQWKVIKKIFAFWEMRFAFRAHAALLKLSRPAENSSRWWRWVSTDRSDHNAKKLMPPSKPRLSLVRLFSHFWFSPPTNARSANKANLHKSLKFLKK